MFRKFEKHVFLKRSFKRYIIRNIWSWLIFSKIRLIFSIEALYWIPREFLVYSIVFSISRHPWQAGVLQLWIVIFRLTCPDGFKVLASMPKPASTNCFGNHPRHLEPLWNFSRPPRLVSHTSLSVFLVSWSLLNLISQFPLSALPSWVSHLICSWPLAWS